VRISDKASRTRSSGRRILGDLRRLGITRERHRRIATEGALLGSILHHGLSPQLAIISDDAGQLDVLLHGLCWVHAERLVGVKSGRSTPSSMPTSELGLAT
jgi:hypothetical protein